MEMQTTNNNSKSPITLIIAIGALVLILGGGILAYTNNAAQLAEQKKKDDEKAMVMKKESETAMMKKESDAAMMNKDDKMTSTSTSDAMMKKDDAMMSKSTEAGATGTTMSKEDHYKPYDASLLSKAKDGHKVILFFNASWCPTCQATVKDIEANKDKIADTVHILSVDYDKETELKKKYGVTMQHTFVEVDNLGNLLKKTNGLATVNAINDYLK
jgi:thiol-disulfide isomerase/thioredoxin